MTSTARNLPPRPPPHSDNENNEPKIDSNTSTEDSVLSYLTKCGLASHSDISVNDIDESSLALLAGLSHRHLAVGDDDTDTFKNLTNESAVKIVEGSQDEPCGMLYEPTKSEMDDDDTDDDDDDAATAPTNQAVIVQTTNRIKKKDTTKKIVEMKDVSEVDGNNNLPPRPRRSTSTSSFKDKEDETRVQNLYSEYMSIFGSIDTNTKESPAASVTASRNSNSLKNHGFKSELHDESLLKPSALIQEIKSTSNDNSTRNDSRLQNLEPWQEALFERQDRHEKALLECQAKMDAIAKMFVAVSEQRDDYVKGLENILNGAQHHRPMARRRELGGDEVRNPNYSPMWRVGQDELHEGPPPPPPPQQQQQQQQQPPPQQLPLQQPPPPYFILGGIASLLHLPRATYNYISTTRIIRLIALVKLEAERHPMPGGPNARFLDWNMIFKIFFVCFVFGARLGQDGSKNGSGGNDDDDTFLDRMVGLWKMYRVHIFMMCALTTYMLQTGLGQFLYRVFVKENIIRRVWLNEDLVEEGRGQVGDGRRGRRDRRPLNNDGGDAQADDELGDPLQLGNRDGVNLQRGPLGGGVENGGGEMYRQFQRTFLSGAVARRHGAHDINVPGNRGAAEGDQRPIPNRNIHRIVDLVKDVVYLLGSIVLSLFPMWHPRVQVLPPHPERADAGVPENGADHRNYRILPDDRNNNAIGGEANGHGIPRDVGDNDD